MEAKEKAKELVLKMSNVSGLQINKFESLFEFPFALSKAKSCALIACDFAWEQMKPHDDLPEINYSKIAEIKSEIEKL